jgi:hypothetical protein
MRIAEQAGAVLIDGELTDRRQSTSDTGYCIILLPDALSS